MEKPPYNSDNYDYLIIIITVILIIAGYIRQLP